MAEPSLSAEYSEVQGEVALFLGWNRDPGLWTADNNTDFLKIQNHALHEYFYPSISAEQPRYEWDFLRATGTLTLVSNDNDYSMPDDFVRILDESVVYSTSGSNLPPLQKIPEGEVRKLQSNDDQTKAHPKYYAVRNLTFDATVGQRFEFLTYPTPGPAQAGVGITYRYVFVPEPPDATNKYIPGGAVHAEVIREAYLGAAELVVDQDPNGPHHQRFVTLLAQAVRHDREQKDNAGGGIA